MATNLNINKTDVYYTLINNEVFALRLKAVLVDIQSLSTRSLAIDPADSDDDSGYVMINGCFYPSRLRRSKMRLFDLTGTRRYSGVGIDYIRVEMAPLGKECEWRTYGIGDFNPRKIYRTIEDCVAGVNPIFSKNPSNNKMWLSEPCQISLDKITPDNMFWEYNGFDIYGYEIYQLKSYTWNGLHPVKGRVYTKENRMGYNNGYNNPLFDLLDERLLLDDDVVKASYATEDECCEDNSIKVHLFAN